MLEPFRNPDDDTIRQLLESTRRIAVVGLSPKPHRDSHRVAAYILDRGYDVIPVYPREERILGQKVYRRVLDVEPLEKKFAPAEIALPLTLEEARTVPAPVAEPSDDTVMVAIPAASVSKEPDVGSSLTISSGWSSVN